MRKFSYYAVALIIIASTMNCCIFRQTGRELIPVYDINVINNSNSKIKEFQYKDRAFDIFVNAALPYSIYHIEKKDTFYFRLLVDNDYQVIADSSIVVVPNSDNSETCNMVDLIINADKTLTIKEYKRNLD